MPKTSVRAHARKSYNFYDNHASWGDFHEDITESERFAVGTTFTGPLTERESDLIRSAAAFQRGKDEARAGRFDLH